MGGYDRAKAMAVVLNQKIDSVVNGLSDVVGRGVNRYQHREHIRRVDDYWAN